MSTKIILRFDDICPNIDWEKFLYIKKRVQDLGIRSLLGVIPENKDESFLKFRHKDDFFDLINYSLPSSSVIFLINLALKFLFKFFLPKSLFL